GRNTARNVDHATLWTSGCTHLSVEQRYQVLRMQTVTNLVSRPIETNVGQRSSPAPTVDPVREDSLVVSTELPCTSQHSASVDPHRKMKGFTVFQCKLLRRPFRGAIERDRRVCRKRLVHATL